MFRSCQAYAHMIWKRWVAEYLPQTHVRNQWSKQEANVEVGLVGISRVSDLVWLVDNNVKRSHYKIAPIQEIYPAKDGVVRSVLIKTHDGTSNDL